MKFLKLIFVLSIFMYAAQAVAQNYAPGSVILLKKKESEALRTPEQIIEENKKQDKTPAKSNIVNKNITIVRPNAPQVITENQSQKKSDPVSIAYAGQLYSNICAQNYRDTIAPKTEQNLNQQKLWADIQASCKCMANEILSRSAPDELADYVMYNYGFQDEKKPDAESAAYFSSNKSDQISTLIINPQLRKKCGFVN